MEIKKWEEYSKEDKYMLLQHWWHYYGKVVYTLAEWDEFNKLVVNDCDQVFHIAIASYIHGITNQALIGAMRANKVDELMATLPNFDEIDDEEFKENHAKIEQHFISTLVGSYNNPEVSESVESIVVVVKKKEKNNPNIRKGFVN